MSLLLTLPATGSAQAPASSPPSASSPTAEPPAPPSASSPTAEPPAPPSVSPPPAEPPASRTRAREVPTTTSIEVIGEAPEALQAVPGSAAVIDERQLELTAPIAATEVLRTVTGVHIVEEEGIGLRANIGFRGLDPDRSRTVLVLEDGVPISMAPYGGPELYYSPPVERMRRLEVVKGSGSVLFGPQTVGGVVNYITPDPPQKLELDAEARYGSFGYALARAGIGETRGQVGYLIQTLYQTYEGPRALNLRRADVNGKLRLELGPGSWLGVKANVYHERSNSTYLGLTTAQYEANPQANYAIHDLFDVNRYALSVNHSWFAGPSLFVKSVAYGHTVQRDWRRQDYDRKDCRPDDPEAPIPTGCQDYERIIDGSGQEVDDAPDDASAIFFQDSAGTRARGFRVAGLESQLAWSWRLPLVEGELTAGARFHYEDGVIRYIQGDFAASSTGVLREDERRNTRALALYALNRFSFRERLRVSPGVRLEALVTERTILAQPETAIDSETGESTGEVIVIERDPPLTAEAPLVAVIPGIGFSFDVTTPLTLFAGVHRGFAPPRAQDAISDEGVNVELEPEYSWNYELGVRWRVADLLEGELAGFYLDFQNQVIPPSESSGSVSDTLVNGGATQHAGVEVRVATDPALKAGWGFELPVSVNYTFVRARFGTCDEAVVASAEIPEGCWSPVIEGNLLPYAPEHIVTGQVGFIHPLGLALQLTGNFVSAQFTDKENTLEPTVDGLRGAIDPRFLLDARVAWTVKGRYTLSLTGKNLTDTLYIASRRPAGIQAGAPRQVLASIEGRF